MSSIYDQYESSRSVDEPIGNNSRKMQTTSRTSTVESTDKSFETLKMEETPIFTKNKIHFKPPQPITHLTICNNMLCMVMSGSSLMRINLTRPDDVDEIELTKGNNAVHKIHLDPTGRFLLITFTSEESSFLNANSKKPKVLQKFKGHRIESVGWCNTVSTNSTGPILIGSNRGLIMESCIDTGDDTKFFAGSVDQYFKQLYNFNQGDTRNLAVTSLEYFSTCSTNSGSRECCVLASTSSRLYQFSGVVNFSTDEVPVFQNFFSLYHASPPRHIDLQPDEEGDRKLRLFYNTDRRPLHHAVAPTQFGWMTPQGVYFGSVKPSSGVDQATALAQRTVIGNAYLMPYPEIKVTNKNRFEESNNDVIDMVMTEFHILLLYPDRLRVICSLNQQLIFEDIYTSRYGQLIGLFKDPVDGQIWAYTERAVFKYKIVRESRDVWEIYLKMKKFEMAESNCHEDPVKLDKVYSCQAEHAFEKGQYQESALYYAITRTSFEEVALKFINKSKEGALRAYLQKKLSNLQRDDVTQLTMLSTWLVELYLNQLGQLRDDENLSDQYGKCTEDLRKLFKQDYLRQVFQENRSTIYDLLISHGDIDNYVFFSILMQDYERVVNHHIQNNNYLDALEALKRQNSISLYYKFSPTLMQVTVLKPVIKKNY